MRKVLKKSGYLLFSIVLLSLTLKGNIKTLEIGAKMPAMKTKLLNFNNEEVTIDSFFGEKGTLVIFSCNTCPFVIGGGKFSGWEKDYNRINKIANAYGIKTVLVNSNEAKRDNGDNLKDMIAHSKEKGYTMPYVLDKKHKFADAFGAKTTPHVFLFDAGNKLFYEGQIDDSFDPQVKEVKNYLENALTALNKGEKLKVNKTNAVGCSIKRVK